MRSPSDIQKAHALSAAASELLGAMAIVPNLKTKDNLEMIGEMLGDAIAALDIDFFGGDE